jgi:hypothetical protein
VSAKIWQMRKAPNGYYDREDRRRWRLLKRSRVICTGFRRSAR